MTPSTRAPFREALALVPADVDAADAGTERVGFAATLTDTWTIGPKAHGGMLLALCASAAHRATGEAADATAVRRGAGPVAVSATFLRPPDPGPAGLVVDVVRRGRRVTIAEVELRQAGRGVVRAVVTLGAHDEGEPLHRAAELAAAMPPEPPAGLGGVDQNPLGEVVRLAQVCDLVLDPGAAAFARGEVSDDPALQMWVRPHGEDPDLLFALMAGDVSPPVTLNLGRFGWAPTVTLTALLRRAPAPGWLRVRSTTTSVGQSWFDEDAVVLDSTGAVVVQTRQLAMVPEAGSPPPG